MGHLYSFQTDDNIRREARDWVLKFNGDMPPTETDIVALREWAGRSPAHRAELERATAFWCDADLLSELAVPIGRYADRTRTRIFSRLLVSFSSVNRAGALAAAVLMAVAVSLFVRWDPVPGAVGNGVYSTAVGEQTLLTLPDASQIQLDTNSQVRVAYTDGVRQIHLLTGKAHFDVASRPDRPFEVYAGSGMIRAVGTAFSVYLADDDVEVTVSEGRVDLARAIVPAAQDMTAPPDDTAVTTKTRSNGAGLIEPGATHDVFLSVKQGQSVLFSQHSEIVNELGEKELSRELAWREGLLIFAGDPLSRVVSEVNRYTTTKIEIIDPALDSLMIGGRFRVGELEALFDALENGFGVHVGYLDKDHIQLYSSSR